MANVTKIKAKDEPTKTEKAKKPETKPEAKTQPTKAAKPNSEDKKTFILFRPFVAFFRYLRDSWREIRQVRWPNRKATWKMVLAVFIYTAMFLILISLLDLFFTWLFSLIIK